MPIAVQPVSSVPSKVIASKSLIVLSVAFHPLMIATKAELRRTFAITILILVGLHGHADAAANKLKTPQIPFVFHGFIISGFFVAIIKP